VESRIEMAKVKMILVSPSVLGLLLVLNSCVGTEQEKAELEQLE
jgi:hypothetical protein